MKNQLSTTARILRKRSTDEEQFLWRHLRALRSTDEVIFRRQHPIGSYIVDFVSLEKMLVIELDGGHHKKQKQQDSERDAWLRKSGYEVMRIWNSEVMKNTESVLKKIQSKIR